MIFNSRSCNNCVLFHHQILVTLQLDLNLQEIGHLDSVLNADDFTASYVTETLSTESLHDECIQNSGFDNYKDTACF